MPADKWTAKYRAAIALSQTGSTKGERKSAQRAAARIEKKHPHVKAAAQKAEAEERAAHQRHTDAAQRASDRNREEAEFRDRQSNERLRKWAEEYAKRKAKKAKRDAEKARKKAEREATRHEAEQRARVAGRRQVMSHGSTTRIKYTPQPFRFTSKMKAGTDLPKGWKLSWIWRNGRNEQWAHPAGQIPEGEPYSDDSHPYEPWW